MTATIFVGTDAVLDPTLSAIAGELARRGHRIVRPAAAPSSGRTVFGRDVWPQYFGDAAVAVVSSRTELPADLLAAAPRLRGVVFPSIGTDSCDLAAATELGIAVANGATERNVQSMAEAAVMLIAALRLELPRKLRQFDEHAGRPVPGPETARMVAGCTVGLVGYGRIAREVARRLAGWDVARILACRRTLTPLEPGDARCGVELVDLHTLLRDSDVISLHLPLTAQTRGLVGAAELAMTKPGSILVNTARGGLVDEEALARALQSGHLAAAAVDTFATEPPAADHPLSRCSDVLLTRHNAGHTRELFASLVPAAVENVLRILDGRTPLHLCNPQVLPAWRAVAEVPAC